MLFNHRNKLPGSEVRTFSTGWEDDHDGVELEYVAPEDDAVVSMYLPADRSAINEKRYQTVGVRNRVQAHFHAYRMWNRMRYQYLMTEFTSTQEGFLLLVGDRILVADNTKGTSQNGEVKEQNGLILTLSQDVEMEDNKIYYGFFQLADGTVEPMRVLPGERLNQVVLQTAPRLPFVTDTKNYARTTYVITENFDRDINAFLVGDIKHKDNITATITASNYDERYYANDADYIKGIVQ